MVLELVKPSIQEKKYRLSISKYDAKIPSDADQRSRSGYKSVILLNLVSNAIKFTARRIC